MRSSSGAYYPALDHVRAVAAFMVFSWHFVHSGLGVPLSATPWFAPLAVFDEGHTGVSLFMVLSGYLFTKLLAGDDIDYRRFLANRAFRLLPLLLVFLAISAFTESQDALLYMLRIAAGLVFPLLPGASWSLAIEFQFYLLLPLLLWVLRRRPWALLALLAAVIIFRAMQAPDDLRLFSYQTLFGRIDQFIVGMLACHLGAYVARRHLLMAGAALPFVLFYWWFDAHGGYYDFPEPRIWIVLPTIEAAFYGLAVAYYDRSFAHASTSLPSRGLALLGKYSYSIYLLGQWAIDLSRPVLSQLPQGNVDLAVALSFVAFPLMLPIGYLSYKLIEEPFLRLRRSYRRPTLSPAVEPLAAVQEV